MQEAAAILRDLKCPFVINQNRYSIFDRTIENNGLKEAAVKEKKGLIAFSPLAQGTLTDRYLYGIPADSRVMTDGRFLKKDQLTEEKSARSAPSTRWPDREAKNSPRWRSNGS